MRMTITTDQTRRAAQRLRAMPAEVRAAVAKIAFTFGAKMVATAVDVFRSAPATTSTATRRRTGMLARALGHKVDVTNTGVTLTFGYLHGPGEAALAYAPTQEFGATIRPRKAKWLTIPLEAALTPAGVPRGPARSFTNTFFIPIKGGRELLLMQRRSGHDAVPLFLLTKGPITIPARPALAPSFQLHRQAFVAALARVYSNVQV